MGKLRSLEIILDGEPVYEPGDEVRGRVVVEVRGGDLKVKYISIVMRGGVRVHWTESHAAGNRLGATSEHYNGTIEYFFKKRTLLGTTSEHVDSSRYEVLRDGHQEFPFAFQLPTTGICTSFEGKYGSIRYWLKAEVSKPWCAFNRSVKKTFTVIVPFQTECQQFLMEPQERLAEKTVCCLFCRSQPVSLYVRANRRWFCPGESIMITADIENGSGRRAVPHATLLQTQIFVASGGRSRARRIHLTTLTGVAVPPHRTTTWDAQLLKIPPVPPSITNCPLIRVGYVVKVTLKMQGAMSLSVELPITIGTLSASLRNLPSPSSVIPWFQPPPTYAESIEGSRVMFDWEDPDGEEGFHPLYAYCSATAVRCDAPPSYQEVLAQSSSSHHRPIS